jgi:hypothetical protein
MGKIVLKTMKRKTTVTRSAVRKAVREVLGLNNNVAGADSIRARKKVDLKKY